MAFAYDQGQTFDPALLQQYGQPPQPQMPGGGAPQKLDPAALGGGAMPPQGPGALEPMAAGAQAPAGAGMPSLDGNQQLQPAAAGTPQTYTSDQFGQWYQGQYGNALTSDQWNQIGNAVGAPGENGQYTQDQWNTGQQLAKGFQNQPAFFPEFQPPAYESGPAYQAPAKFQAPTMEQAQNDPGYQFALKQGIGSIMSGAAARGVARTGGTMKGLIDYGQQAAAQQYDKVYGRAAQEYAQDYQIGRDAWGVNQQQRDAAYDRRYKGESDRFNAGFRAKEMAFEDLYRRWRDNLNVNTQLALAD